MPIIGVLLALALLGLSVQYWFVTLPILGIAGAFTTWHYWRREIADFSLPEDKRLALWAKRAENAALRRQRYREEAEERRLAKAADRARKK